MVAPTEPLRIFVAMPGTMMGETAPWKDIKQIEDKFYNKIQAAVQELLKRPVSLVIEKNKLKAGSIHRSMFREAWEADVYIADLTGNNPNVYLELGVRWAVRDGVTVIVSQRVDEIKFNAASSRAILYASTSDPDDLVNSIERVTTVILNGLKATNHCDSPVRDGESLVLFKRDELETLETEIRRLRMARGEDLLTAARATTDGTQRLKLLLQVVEVNPARIDGWLDLAEESRKQEAYGKAIEAARQAIALDPENARAHKELGAVFSKQEDWDRAIEALREAVRLEPKNGDALSILGGAYRRKGMGTGGGFDWDSLRRSRDTYSEAGKLDPYDTYPLLNVAKLDLILSREEPARKKAAEAQFKNLQYLCNYRVTQTASDPEPYWARFDLADAYLLSGDVKDGLENYRLTMASIPPERRSSVFSSVASPLENLLRVGVVQGDTEVAVRTILAELSSN